MFRPDQTLTEQVVERSNDGQEQTRKNTRIGQPVHLTPSDDSERMIPGQTLGVLERRSWSGYANQNVNATAEAERPPGLHHKGNAPPRRNDLLRADHRKIDDKMRIPVKVAMHSGGKVATRSGMKVAAVGAKRR